MIDFSKRVIRLLVAAMLLGGYAWGDTEEHRKRALTHVDAAVILAKYSGYFDRYVDQDADVDTCVAFLNGIGVYFGLMEVINASEFTLEDCARAMGQIDLILTGEAQFSLGKVKLPKEIESWTDFCTMHGVGYVEGHRAMLRVVNKAGVR